MLFGELAELAGQRNAIDGRIVEIVAGDGSRPVVRQYRCPFGGGVGGLETRLSSANAKAITTVAGRLEEFPRCTQGLREGRLSLDQVGVIAARAGGGSDEHYAQLAAVATVNQLRTAIKLEPRPEPDPRPEPRRSITTTGDEQST